MKNISERLFAIVLVLQLVFTPVLAADSKESVNAPQSEASSNPKVIAEISDMDNSSMKLGVVLGSICFIGLVIVVARNSWKEERS